MKSPLLGVVFLAFAVNALAQETAPTLNVGDPAPKLEAAKWIKGTPVAEFEKGKVYIVDFWATWCGPCRVAIPHLTSLAKKYEGKVQVIGFSVWENNAKGVEPFVKSMGEKMAYTVAADKLPTPTAMPKDGLTALAYMTASGEDGLPTAFVIDKDSRIAWIGDPMQADETLDKVLNGHWDTSAYAAQVKVAKEAKRRREAFDEALTNARKSKNDAEALKVIEAMIADTDFDTQADGSMAKFRFYLQSQTDIDTAFGLGRTLLTGLLKDDSARLDKIAWYIVDPAAKLAKRDLDLAIALGDRSVELKKGFANLDTLARAYFLKGDKAKAIELAKEALALAPDDSDKDEIRANIKEYGGSD
jgi:thiol-disulfide isomerase/thioredoxin